jgi:putative acetyltransferase
MTNSENAPVPFTLRLGRPEDASAILDVYRSAVRGIPERFYSREVIDGWAPIDICSEHAERLAGEMERGQKIVAIAEDEGGSVAGFGSIGPADSQVWEVYVRPDRSRAGVGRAILGRLEDLARDEGLIVLNVTASINAETFFAASGFIVESRGAIFLGSQVSMACVLMQKPLIAADRYPAEFKRRQDPFWNIGQVFCDALNEHHRTEPSR